MGLYFYSSSIPAYCNGCLGEPPLTHFLCCNRDGRLIWLSSENPSLHLGILVSLSSGSIQIFHQMYMHQHLSCRPKCDHVTVGTKRQCLILLEAIVIVAFFWLHQWLVVVSVLLVIIFDTVDICYQVVNMLVQQP